jgi:hypothetical protein
LGQAAALRHLLPADLTVDFTAGRSLGSERSPSRSVETNAAYIEAVPETHRAMQCRGQQ